MLSHMCVYIRMACALYIVLYGNNIIWASSSVMPGWIVVIKCLWLKVSQSRIQLHFLSTGMNLILTALPLSGEPGGTSDITETVDLATMVSGVVGAVVLTLVSLTAVVIIVVVLGRKVLNQNAEVTQRRAESPERSGTVELGWAAGEKGGKEKANEFVHVKSSATGREALYQLRAGCEDPRLCHCLFSVERRNLPGAGPSEQGGGAPLPECQLREGGTLKEGVIVIPCSMLTLHEMLCEL